MSRFITSAFCLLPFAFGQAQPAGSARLSGLVLTADASPQPVRRAIVTLTGGIQQNISAITDDEGRFTFAELPAGRFMVTARKPAFITAAYGARAPGRPGTPIALGSGATVSDLRITMSRGAAVMGIVRDHTGEPAVGVQVTVQPAQLAAARGSGVLSSTSDVILTDDRGMFRLFGLSPGEYVVAAVPRFTAVGEMGVMTSAEIDAALQRLQKQTGVPRGVASGLPIGESTRSNRSYGYAPIFYPGTSIATQATKIRLGVGEERSGIDIPLNLVPMASIEGVVLGLGGGTPTTAMLSIAVTGPPMPLVFGMSPTLSVSPGAEGKFKYTNVPPGAYTISARTRPIAGGRAVPTPGVTVNLAPTGSPGTVPVQWASADVEVNGTDLSGVTLTLQPGLTMSGRVAFDSSSLKPPENLTALRVSLSPPTTAGTPTLANMAGAGTVRVGTAQVPVSAAVRADGTFEIVGIVPATYRLISVVPGTAGPGGWWLRSAILGDRDLSDGAVEIGGSDLAGVTILFSDRHTELSGTLQAAGGLPAAEYYVIAFAADRGLWHVGSRRVVSTRPATDGGFRFEDLPPGDYVLAALTDLPDEWQDAAFLKQVISGGVKVALGEGEKKTQDLRIK